MQRAAPGGLQANRWAIAGGCEQRSEHHRDDSDDGDGRGASGKRKHGAPDAREPPFAIEPPGEDEEGEHVKPDERHLVASDNQEGDDDASRKADPP